MLPVRSAAPDTNPGNVGTHAARTLPMAWRVAIFSPCSKVGSACSQPLMPVPFHAASHAARSSESSPSSDSAHRARSSAHRSAAAAR